MLPLSVDGLTGAGRSIGLRDSRDLLRLSLNLLVSGGG
jgi:hypothetical protein